TAFHWQGLDKPVQVVHRRVNLPLAQLDWSELPSAEQVVRLRAHLKTDQERGFELTEAPLLRLCFIRLGESSAKLILSFHHLLLDGWSLLIVFEEAAAFYTAYCRGEDFDAPPRPPYSEYIAWLQQQD